ACAGTGACGLEAMSRGAAEAVFIDRDGAALAALRRNVEALGEAARARVIPGDATRPPRGDRACAIAFLDPPYGSGLAAPALAALAAADWLAPGAVPVIEIPAPGQLGPAPGFMFLEERVHGAARLVFLDCGAVIGGLP